MEKNANVIVNLPRTQFYINNPRLDIRVQEIIQEEYPDVYERRMNHKINAFLDRRILKADSIGCGE